MSPTTERMKLNEWLTKGAVVYSSDPIVGGHLGVRLPSLIHEASYNTLRHCWVNNGNK